MNDISDFETHGEADQEVVAFRVADQDFCFDIMSVREIRGWSETTILPHAESFVKGVINLRGSVVPVIDLSERLGFGPTEPGPRHVIIIAVVNDQTVGLLADVVSDIVTVVSENVHPVPELAAPVAERSISGIVMADERMIRKLDLATVLPTLESTAA